MIAALLLAAAIYPNPKLTPGAIFPTVTEVTVCKPGYTATVRNVPESVKREVMARYGLNPSATKQYEIDHFISLELGGSNDVANLWPEAYAGTLGAREKDKVETWLRRQICEGKISLQDAQTQIKVDWVKVYHECCSN